MTTTRPPTRRCASCDAVIVPIDTGWGTNWVRPGRNGLCQSAPNGIHWPTP
ncbi:hypothetical protein AB0395_44830 [Streptosporangium sp. NPDC051023]|uniref:hypothetical protein n=1 Tax=Streptosporangium sp. NPDC051023 TaxID=3155410 RepID=UPI00344FA543